MLQQFQSVYRCQYSLQIIQKWNFATDDVLHHHEQT